MYPYHLYDGVPRLEAHKNFSIINTDALKSNYRLLVSTIHAERHICVVKADAYGHSAEICVPALIECGCRFFAVSCIEEAMAVRAICSKLSCDADILILGYTDPSHVKMLSENRIIQAAVSFNHAKKLAERAVREKCVLRVHLAIDTGMNRIGICAHSKAECERASIEAAAAVKLIGLQVEGMFTHFARSDEELEETVSEGSPTRLQCERFEAVKNALSKKGISLFCHVCNSAAAMRFPEYLFDAVRIGIMLYGVYPSEHFDDIGLLPVMSLSTVISHIHTASKGISVSYGGIFAVEKNMRIATLPIGYADGFIRKYSGARVTVVTSDGEHDARVIGRICMDQCMIDITDIPSARAGNRVVIFGQDRSFLRELAERADTIEYECLCLVSARVPRIKK